jgi:hypothetical protein
MVLAERRPWLTRSSMTFGVTLEQLHGSIWNRVGTTKDATAMTVAGE